MKMPQLCPIYLVHIEEIHLSLIIAIYRYLSTNIRIPSERYTITVLQYL